MRAIGTRTSGKRDPSLMRSRARSRHSWGNPVYWVVPVRPTAMPRKSASVPMVTARDGSPTYATRKPLIAPQTVPATTAAAAAAGIDQDASKCRSAITTALSPITLATERSISPVMMISVIGSAMRSTGARSRNRK